MLKTNIIHMQKEQKLAIFTACKGYSIEDVAPWTQSLKASGFDGKVFVIMYDPPKELADYFKEQDFYVLVANEEGLTHIATQRFRDYAQILKSDYCVDIDYVLHTDIRDVLFQSNPAEWLSSYIDDVHKIYASAEGVKYKHEDWNGDGVQFHFGENIFRELADTETLCSGVFCGEKEAFIDLCEAMYQAAFFTKDPAGFIDQHFYNLLIRKSFAEITQIVPADTPFVANLGTLAAIPFNSPEWSTGPRTPYNSYERFRSGTYVENMLVEVPEMIDGKVCTPDGKPYCIVHQYDRYAPWKEELHEKIGLVKYVS
jgi:hypothetical protein